MSLKKPTNAEEVFNYLKRNDLDFKKSKEDSEYSNSWVRFKDAMLSDKSAIKYLEGRIDECNQKITNNISQAQLTKKSRLRNKKTGHRNVESGHWSAIKTKEHQIKANKAAQSAIKIINAKRLNDLIEFILERLPKEFTDSDVYRIINNNSDNTLFQRSQNNSRVLKPVSIFRKFTSNAKNGGLTVCIKRANQHQPNTYYIINSVKSDYVITEKTAYEYSELVEFAYGI